jgi:hypothetical protein
MKKIFFLILMILLFVLFSSGCTDDDSKEDEMGTKDNFIGTWKTADESGAFAEGNMLRFNDDNTFEKYWDHGGGVYHSGTWAIRYVVGKQPELAMVQGEISYNYTYTFYEGFTKVKLFAENATSGRMYVRQ